MSKLTFELKYFFTYTDDGSPIFGCGFVRNLSMIVSNPKNRENTSQVKRINKKVVTRMKKIAQK